MREEIIDTLIEQGRGSTTRVWCSQFSTDGLKEMLHNMFGISK